MSTTSSRSDGCGGAGEDDPSPPSSIASSKKDDVAAYHDIFSSSVVLSGGYVKNDILTLHRSVRDVDTNSKRTFVYHVPLPHAAMLSSGKKEDESGNGGGGKGDNSPIVMQSLPPQELSLKVKMVLPSPSGKKVAKLIEEDVVTSSIDDKKKSRQVVEVWSEGGTRLDRRIVLPDKMHGKVCTDTAWFGGWSWRPVGDEDAIVYVAEESTPKACSYFGSSDEDKSSNGMNTDGGGEESVMGSQYTMGIGQKEDWGEKYTGTSRLKLFVLSTATGRVEEVKNVPQSSDDGGRGGGNDNAPTTTTTLGGFTLGQPTFSPDGSAIVYTAWDAGGGGEMSRRLGMVHCQQRPSKLYSSSVVKLLRRISSSPETTTSGGGTGGTTSSETSKGSDSVRDERCICLTTVDRIARSPRFFHPSRKQVSTKLTYLASTRGFDTHNGCMALHVMTWDLTEGKPLLETRRVLVDVVDVPVKAKRAPPPATQQQPPPIEEGTPPKKRKTEDGSVATISPSKGGMLGRSGGCGSGGGVDAAAAVMDTCVGMSFPGLFLSVLPKECFSPDGAYIYLSSLWGSVSRVLRISTADGTIVPLRFRLDSARKRGGDNKDGASSGKGPSDSATYAPATGIVEDFYGACSQDVVCVSSEGIVVTESDPTRPAVVGVLLHAIDPSSGEEEEETGGSHSSSLDASGKQLVLQLSPMSISAFAPVVQHRPPFDADVLDSKGGVEGGFIWRVLRRSAGSSDEEDEDGIPPFQSILLLPDPAKNGDGRPPPLIVVPHGGPHSCLTTNFMPAYAYLCRHGGYAVLQVNYRGSTGFGQSFLESLPGHVGRADVSDVVRATQTVIRMGLVDATRVGICGGSHGGFLSAHAIGQFPDLFHVAAMRNPVTNIPTMVTATDIPDWTYVESLGPRGSYDWKTFRPPTREAMLRMYNSSPVAHIDNVRAPTLVALGMSDRRVPPSQGMEYYHSLRARGLATKLLVYDGDDHAIDQPASEADHWINVKRWFDEHLK